MSLTPKPFRTFLALLAVCMVAAGAQTLSQLSHVGSSASTNQLASAAAHAAPKPGVPAHSRVKASPAATTSLSGTQLSAAPASAADPPTVACTGDVTAKLQAAVLSHANGTVTIGAGSCWLSDNIAVRVPVTIAGAGPAATFLVQHADADIFGITAPNVTISGLNLDTATYHPGVPPVPGNPAPPVIYASASHTSVLDVTAETGTGYGLRIVGPAPCYTYPTQGTVIRNLVMSNHGSAGFAAVDLSCTNGVTVTNLTVNPGGIVAVYKDENVFVDTEHYISANRPCQSALELTSGTNFTIRNIYGGGRVLNKYGATNVSIVNDVPYTGSNVEGGAC